jgi:hypothetical protein
MPCCTSKAPASSRGRSCMSTADRVLATEKGFYLSLAMVERLSTTLGMSYWLSSRTEGDGDKVGSHGDLFPEFPYLSHLTTSDDRFRCARRQPSARIRQSGDNK